MTEKIAWTPQAIRALGATTTVTVAAEILDVSRGTAYAMVKAGTFPPRVLTLGRRKIVVVASLLATLGLPVEVP